MPDSLLEILAENNIHPKHGIPDAGRSVNTICPECGGGKHKEISLSVTADDDGAGFVWHCHRGTCGWTGSGRMHGKQSPHAKKKVYRKPEPQFEEQPKWLYEWWAKRDIRADAVDHFGIYAHKGAIVFPYVWQGEVRNRKFRCIGEDKRMWQEQDPLPTLYNIDALGENPEIIIFVEGEPDCVAMWEAGYDAVSLKDGAPKKANFENDALRFEAFKTHADLLARAKAIILAGDTDEPGVALREEIARRLGRHRCHIVTWPEGCKDANEVKQKLGIKAILAAMADREPFPIEGIQSVYTGALVELANMPQIPTMSSGLKSADEKIMLPTEGRLCIITGWPGSGKSAWTRFLMVTSIARHGRRWAVFSPEMQPWQEFLASCAEVVVGKPFWTEGRPDKPGYRERMTTAECAYAERWLSGNMHMIVSDALEPPSLDWVLDKARICVARDGITDLLLDPWNELDNGNRDGMTETDYIGRCLQRLKSFCARYGCNVWIVAHPTKPVPLKPGEKHKPPLAYDISGSSHWFNKADLGITIDSPDDGVADVICWKSRVRRWSYKGATSRMAYDKLTGRYSEQSQRQLDLETLLTPLPMPARVDYITIH